MVLIHGLGGNLAAWFLNMVPRLRDDYRITAYDLRGHGKSSIPPEGYTTADMAHDLLGLLDGLQIDRANVLGHSWGADVAMHFAILYPERVERLVVAEPNIAALIDWRKSKDWEGWSYWAKRLEEFGVHVPREKWHDVDYMLRQTIHIPMQFGPLKGRPRKNTALFKLLDETTIVKDYEKVAGMTLDKVKGIPRPTLALYGEKSHFRLTYEYLKDQVPRVEAVLLEGGDHYGALEHPEMILEHLKAFLRQKDGMTEIQPRNTGDHHE